MLASSASFTAQWLTEALGGKWNGRTGTAKCPAHQDHTPSMSITTGQKQDVVVHCFVCDQKDIVAKLIDIGLWPRSDRAWAPPVLHISNGMSVNDSDEDEDENGLIWPESKPVTPINKEIATYQYRDESGALLYEKLRYANPKTFKQRQPNGTWSINGVRHVLYRLPELLAASDATVWLCEGEKDADTLTGLGLVATTATEGATLSWSDTLTEHWKQYAEQLRGRNVIILPDNDDVGRAHATQILATLLPVVRTVRILHLEGLPEKGDVSDWVAAGGTAAQLAELAQVTGQRFTLRTVEDIENMPPPTYLANGWLVQKTLSELYGPSGVGKSFIVLDLLLSVASGGEWLGSIPVVQGPVVYIVAEGVGGLQKRIRAWKARHPDADLSLMRFVTVPVNMLESPEVNDLLNCIRVQCSDNPVIVAIDTLARSMSGGDENSTKDMSAVVVAADHIRVMLECHVLIVHHTGKNGENDRGSSALRGACDTMIMVTKDDSAIRFHCDKQKDSIEPADIGLKLVPVDGTDSCVVELFDQSGQLTTTARKLLSVLYDCFPLNEGASTTAWLKASGLPDNTFYASRRLLLSNQCVSCDKRGAPNIITTVGCRDLGIEPIESTPNTTTDYYRTTTAVVEAHLPTTTTDALPLGEHGSSSSGAWWGDQD